MQFLFAPLQGTLSDSFGRRPVILISNFGVGLDYVLMALAPTLGGCLPAGCFPALPLQASPRPTRMWPT
jgi:MFS family permease